jgi:hypothetical protein
VNAVVESCVSEDEDDMQLEVRQQNTPQSTTVGVEIKDGIENCPLLDEAGQRYLHTIIL